MPRLIEARPGIKLWLSHQKALESRVGGLCASSRAAEPLEVRFPTTMLGSAPIESMQDYLVNPLPT